MCQILCGVSTARGLAITKVTVQSILDLFVRNVAQEVMTTIPPRAKINQNVSSVAKNIFQGQTLVKFGRKRNYEN